MAVRKSWMSAVRKSTNLGARFFVAMHARKEVNVELKKKAEFFGDIVIVPYMDSYDLVVLKTVAICEYGVHAVSAKYIMKCDDDTFVRIDSVLKVIKKVPSSASLYVGNINYYHKPLRYGKWAVTYEVQLVQVRYQILAGALKDNRRAVLYGEPTFSEGKIQSVFELSDGSSLAVTVARNETSAHTDIDKVEQAETSSSSRKPRIKISQLKSL